MNDRSHVILPAPVRRRRPSFVLTSLIDVIFLLVIFFMVSSQIVPYSLLPLGPLAADSGAPAPAPGNADAPPIAVRILSGSITIGGRKVPVVDAETAFRDLKQRGVTSLLLTPSAVATVQDVVTVLEASKAAEMGSVTVLGRREP
ncbi:biopolymer transporter ExbD [Mesorhizobium sp. LHD-90]|uniref:ExbD/TolR family protein n=1 Tax=Mesorhizobium sp. LHD-90 TaxID=3071414 RepID=UPI0027E14919|nr:biopolymer transporter ExbD [Mesorhizobium sp. LHD-90]MDQ6434703.1 biopolymer transporter ExbD [Mesorhizobium sp. LHD-90]